MRWVDDTDGSFLCVALRDEAFLDPLDPLSLLFSRFICSGRFGHGEEHGWDNFRVEL